MYYTSLTANLESHLSNILTHARDSATISQAESEARKREQRGQELFAASAQD